MRTSLCVFLLVVFASVSQAAPTGHLISVPIPRAEYTITETSIGHSVSADGYGTLHEPGVPQLPVRIFPIAVPPGAEVMSVSYTSTEPVTMASNCAISPAPVWEPVGQDNLNARVAEQQCFDANRSAIYSTNEMYPAAPIELVRTAGYRGYNLVDVRVTPLAYRPLSGQLLRYNDLVVHVRYHFPEQESKFVCESSPTFERDAQSLILNYDQAAAWHSGKSSSRTESNQFVVITLEDLVDVVAPLVSWEQQKGRSTQIVTTAWIAANYTGVDLAHQIRNFLRDKYSDDAWGIEHVLLVGHYSDLPMRQIWQDVGYGHPFTDTYYAELSLVDEKSWDIDGDGRYAEEEDEVDFYNEVCVGRIPWSDPAVVQHIVQKSILFERNHDPAYKRNMLLLGAFFWPDTDCAVLMESIASLSHLADWTSIRMYESGYSTYWMDYDITNANVLSEWAGGKYAVVNWCGHGSTTSAHRYYQGMPAFIASTDCDTLDDNYPSVVFADSCYTSSPAAANLGREMLRQGAIGYVGATQVAGGRRGWETLSDGSSQTLNYLFTRYVTSGEYTQGEALHLALRQTYLQGAWRWPKYEMLEWGALYGNPDLKIGSQPALHIQFPDGLPDYVIPGEEASVVVRIDPVQDTVVVGSETLHYRLDGGSFQTVPLISLGGKHYEAVLPAARCADMPEFYVSAQGVASGLITQPANAPSEVFSIPVGTFSTVFYDDFEDSTGWMAENLGATDGDWQVGVPVDDPSWPYDPFSDSDGSGQCALTANRFGDSDVDDGGVRLTSPVFSMTAENNTLQYSFYLYAEDQTSSDYLLVEISCSGLEGPWYELVRHTRNNGLSWRSDSFTDAELQSLGINLTDQMRVRFTAYDGGVSDVVEAGVDALEVLSFSCIDVVLGDLDGDGDVDLDDFSVFIACMGGADVTTPPPSCDPDDFSGGDLDSDGDVDLIDFSAFQAEFIGE